MRYQIITYGCQMNKSDSQRISKVLESLGFSLSKNPDLTIINVCSVRQSAVDRAKSKAKQTKNKLLITGCILQKDKKDFEKLSDALFNINDLSKLPEILKKLGFKIKKTDLKYKHYLELEPKYENQISAYVPIMTGCNNFCSYCVVPYTRGKEISRPTKEIICEAKHLIKKGTKEIWLLGQNVNSFKPSFPKLLKEVNNIPGKFWLRFTSSNPKDLTKQTIQIMANCEKITPYINLPIQSGDNEILKAMNRPYTVEKYKQLIKELRKAFSQPLAISTDVIVGFPGETKQQFNSTKKVFREIKFSFAYISRYSPRPGTRANKLKNNVSSQEKKQREKQLQEIVEATALEFNKQFVNKEIEALVLKKTNNFFIGKTKYYQTIKFKAKDNLLGKFIQAKVTKANPYGLEAKI